ncbi:MAG: hypothetical protein AAFR88_05550, partial [Pseudomonadota bacterium]
CTEATALRTAKFAPSSALHMLEISNGRSREETLMKLEFAVLALFCSTEALAADQFDLLCTGTEVITTFDGEEQGGYSKRYRIDLVASQWCEDECKRLHPIKAVQPTSITLDEKSQDGPSENSILLDVINRQTGVHRVISQATYPGFPALGVSIKRTGMCEPAPFSGFPSFDTKF